MAKNLGRVVGKSAYEIWLDEGNTGTEQQFIDSLQGSQGSQGIQGDEGPQGPAGTIADPSIYPVESPEIGDTVFAEREGIGIRIPVNVTTWEAIKGLSWNFLVAKWSVEPTELATIASGVVWEYTLESTTRYRLVPTPYSPTQDAFYEDFDGTNLTNLITTRG